MRALIIDDDAGDRGLAARALKEAFPGLHIDELATDADLRRALDKGGYELAVTDYALGWTNGLEVLDRLLARFPGLTVIMFTGSGNEEICAEGMKRGLADYVIKAHGKYQRLAHAARAALERRDLRGRIEALLAEERAAREEAERASRLKEEFLATLSHELRTPLHSMLGWTQLLRKGALGEADQQRALEVIERNTRAQARLIEDLLDLSRLESGKLSLEIEEVDLGPVVLAAMTAVPPMAQAKRISITPVIGERAGEVRADAARVRQMVLNLLTNAIKFSPDGSAVEVRMARTDGHVEIEVEDHGYGIAAEFLPHVFDRFRQADSSTTRRSGGMGIGLALVKKLAEAHGGRVSARSEGPGKGACFTVSLPLPKADELSEHAPRVDREKPPSLEGVRVLAIDDDADSLHFMERLLQHCQAEVDTATDAEAGLRALGERPPHVLVCDIGMPGTDGYALINRVRCLPDEKVRKVPAIALTAFAFSEDRERALLAGFDSHVSKPVDGYDLILEVASLAGVLDRDKRCEVAAE